jgi:hypothetical protein
MDHFGVKHGDFRKKLVRVDDAVSPDQSANGSVSVSSGIGNKDGRDSEPGNSPEKFYWRSCTNDSYA